MSSVVGFQFTLLAARARGIRGSPPPGELVRRGSLLEAWLARRFPCRSAGPGERRRAPLVAPLATAAFTKHRVACVRGLETIAGPEGLRPSLRFCPPRGSPRHPRRSGGTPLGFPLGGVACSSLSLSQRRAGREEAWSARLFSKGQTSGRVLIFVFSKSRIAKLGHRSLRISSW